MLGHVADNLRRGTSASVQWHELADAVDAGCVVVDVRDAAERTASGVIPGALHLPLDSLRERIDEIPAGPVVVHCAVGVRGHTAARILAQNGRDVRNLDGGIRTWQAGIRSAGSTAPQPQLACT